MFFQGFHLASAYKVIISWFVSGGFSGSDLVLLQKVLDVEISRIVGYRYIVVFYNWGFLYQGFASQNPVAPAVFLCQLTNPTEKSKMVASGVEIGKIEVPTTEGCGRRLTSKMSGMFLDLSILGRLFR